MHEFNQQVIDEFRANGGKVGGNFAGAPMLLLTTTGAKSGAQRVTPLVHTRDGDSFVIIASFAGAPKHPAWFLNIEADASVTVEVGAEKFQAKAEVLKDGAERERLYKAQAALMPNFDEYQQKTTRVIPVVVLKRA
ncbi:MAG: nitroreductase family deazaflavin-dependent oxidoreductase [Dehalococcoidia bacterium]